MYWIGITVNCVVTINALVLDGLRRLATTAINVIRVSSAASIPSTLKATISL